MCPCCNSSAVKTVGPIPPGWRFAGTELLEPLPPTELLRCDHCSFQFRWPSPTVEELSVLYKQGGNEKWDYEQARRTDWQLAAATLNKIERNADVLDVGCWDGRFFSLLNDNWSPFGVEISPSASAIAVDRGVAMLGATMDDLTEDRVFDAVTAFDVIEHVHQPARLLDQIMSVTKRGGQVLVGTGDTQAASWRLMGSRYWYCTNPEHIGFIGRDWCRWYAQSRQVELRDLLRYSHAPVRNAKIRLKQASLNLVYRFVPSLTRTLRRLGFGGSHTARHAAWSDAPPNWMASRDHLMAIFVKP